MCSSVESGWYFTLICREQSFKTISQLLDFKIVATISDGWTNSACGPRKLGRKSAKHLREYYCLGPPAALQPFRQIYLKLSCDTEGKKKKRQTALAAYGILLVKITQLRSFKQFRFESFTSITSGRMQIQACTLCTQPLWLSFSLCQCDSCIAKELL